MTNVSCSLEMCRCCGKITDPNDLIQINSAADVKQELIQCWKIEVTNMDGLPQHICRPCHAKLDDYLRFRKKCLEGQDQLKTLYKNFKNMIGRISIKKKSDEENRKNCDKDSGINKINAANAEKNIHSMQNQNKCPETIITKIINVSIVHKDVIATQKQNQSIQEMASKTAVANTHKSENTIQKGIQIQSSHGIVSRLVYNEANVDAIRNVKNTPQKQNRNQSPQGIVRRLVINMANVPSVQKVGNTSQRPNQIQTSPEIVRTLKINKTNIASIQEIENTTQKPNQIQSPRRTTKRMVETNVLNEENNVNKMQRHNRTRIYNSSAKDSVEFVVFPDTTYSKASISKTYVKGIIKQKTDSTNTDPLDDTEINIINFESEQQHAEDCTLVEDTEIDVMNTKSAQQQARDCTEENTKNILDASFVDETSQSTTVSDKFSVEPEKSDTLEKFDNRLVKEIENSLDETIPLKCNYCISDSEDLFLHNADFPTKAELIEHILLIHDPKYPYKCQSCKNKKYRTRQHCVYHIMHTHKQNKDICQACGIGCGSFKRFIEHKKRFHSFGDYECEICGKKFENVPLSKFEYHKRWHNRNRQMQCTYCAKIFVQLPHLHAHEMTHTKNYKLKCGICGAAFRTHFNKALHMYVVHGGDKPVKCSYCDERFRHYNQRNNHMKKIHNHVLNTIDEKLQCLKCKKLFRREAGLRRHLDTDCLMKETKLQTKKCIFNPRKFPCDQCNYRFRTESGLRQHLALHSKEGRPFECLICHLNFKSNSNLDIHRKLRHSSNKPYECDVCGKCFAFRYILNDHYKSHKTK